MTSIELKSMGVKANMRLDQKTIDQVLAAVRRGQLPNFNSGQSELQRVVQDLQKLEQRADGGLVRSWPRSCAASDRNTIDKHLCVAWKM